MNSFDFHHGGKISLLQLSSSIVQSIKVFWKIKIFNGSFSCKEDFSLRRRQSNPLVYTVCVLVHDILFQIPLSRKNIYNRFWLVKTIVWPNTRQKQANQKRLSGIWNKISCTNTQTVKTTVWHKQTGCSAGLRGFRQPSRPNVLTYLGPNTKCNNKKHQFFDLNVLLIEIPLKFQDASTESLKKTLYFQIGRLFKSNFTYFNIKINHFSKFPCEATYNRSRWDSGFERNKLVHIW